MVENIQELRKQKTEAAEQLKVLKKKLGKYEQAYESLSRFKKTVQSSEEHIQATNAGKLGSVQLLGSVQNVSHTADRFVAGSDSLLNGVGSRIVGMAINALQIAIDVKLAFYWRKIQTYEAQIAVQNGIISTISQTIENITDAFESAAF